MLPDTRLLFACCRACIPCPNLLGQLCLQQNPPIRKQSPVPALAFRAWVVRIILPATEKRRCSFVELMSKVTHPLLWTWDRGFERHRASPQKPTTWHYEGALNLSLSLGPSLSLSLLLVQFIGRHVRVSSACTCADNDQLIGCVLGQCCCFWLFSFVLVCLCYISQYIYIHIYIHTFICMCIYIYTCVSLSIYLYIYI